MAIYQFSNLLGCSTLLDWTLVYKDLPQIFVPKAASTLLRRDIILYYSLQNTAPFQVCVIKHKKEYTLLQGQSELQILFDFIFGKTVLRKDQWTLPVPFPSEDDELSYKSSLLLHEKERFLETRIPHSDFCVTTEYDLELLRCLFNI